MKRLFTLLFIFLYLNINAQIGLPPPTTPIFNYYNNSYVDPNFYIVTLKNGTIFMGRGGFEKINKTDSSILLLTNNYNQKLRVTPNDVKQLIYGKDAKGQVYINYNDRYWLKKLSEGEDQFYYVYENHNLIFIKEDSIYRRATPDEFLNLIKENKHALKLAKKGKYASAISEFNHKSTSPYRTYGKKKVENKN